VIFAGCAGIAAGADAAGKTGYHSRPSYPPGKPQRPAGPLPPSTPEPTYNLTGYPPAVQARLYRRLRNRQKHRSGAFKDLNRYRDPTRQYRMGWDDGFIICKGTQYVKSIAHVMHMKKLKYGCLAVLVWPMRQSADHPVVPLAQELPSRPSSGSLQQAANSGGRDSVNLYVHPDRRA
jgi:hypothetical protein